MPKFVLKSGTSQAKEFELKPGTYLIGRHAENDLPIEDDSVSGTHVQIDVVGNSVNVRDLGSTNGTFIDRSPITQSTLRSGNVLRLGGVELLFQEDAQPTTSELVANPAGAASTSPASTGLRIGTPAPKPSASEKAITLPSRSVIKIAGTNLVVAAPPPPVAVPPLAPVIPVPKAPAQPSGKTHCRFHPRSPGRWSCSQCGNCFCDLCIGLRPASDGSPGHFCRPCGVQCTPMSASSIIHPLEKGNFFSQLPQAFIYPFRDDGWILLIGGTIFFVVVGFLKNFSFYLEVMFLGYLFAYMQNVINTTALGDLTKPDMPEVTNFLEDILQPCSQLSGVVLLCFGPAIGLFVWGWLEDDQFIKLCAIPAVTLGCLYFPMALLGISMFDTITAINPMLIVPSICKVPLQYLAACAALGIAFTARWLGGAYLPYLIPIRIVPTLISSFIGLYFITVQCRILGVLYFINREKLGWFRH